MRVHSVSDHDPGDEDEPKAECCGRVYRLRPTSTTLMALYSGVPAAAIYRATVFSCPKCRKLSYSATYNKPIHYVRVTGTVAI